MTDWSVTQTHVRLLERNVNHHDAKSPMPPAASSTADPAGNESQRRLEKRQAIVDVAARRFAEIGYADCDMAALAKDLGVAKGTLYLYFPSKEELFYACVDAGMQQLQAAVQNAAASQVDPLARISHAVRAYLAFFEAHPEHVELFIQERASFKHRKQPTFFHYREQIRSRWRSVYLELQQQGRLRADLPVERMLENVGNLLYGTMFTNHFAGRQISLDEQHAAIMAIIYRGILPSPSEEIS
ncbi:MAG: TetR/AcrR family transcriptional regulator [Pirellulales bacterium]